MKIIVVGAGKTGFALASMLSEEKHDITIIDTDSKRIDYVANDIDGICLVGSASNPDVLKEAGVEKTDLFVATTAQDEVNMVCCIAAKKLGAKHTIARIRDPQYLEQKKFLQETMGLSMVINPDYECAKEISRILRFPTAVRVDAFSKGSVEIMEYRVRENGKLNNVKLKDLPRTFGAKVLVCIVERGKEVFIPNGDFTLVSGDILNIAGTAVELRKLFVAAGLYQKPVKDVMVMGGGRISVYLNEMLEKSGMRVTIIEKNPKRCEELCDLVPKATIINGDATRNDILLEQGVKDTDAFVAITGDDDDNIITSLYAKHNVVPKIVTKVNRSNFRELLSSVGLESIVTPKDINAQIITAFARGTEDSASGSMETLHRFADGRVEAMEFKVKEGSSFVGKPLKELKLRKNILMSAIIRGNESIIPNGDTEIIAGDHVVLVSLAGKVSTLDDALLNA